MYEQNIIILIIVLSFMALSFNFDSGDSWKLVIGYILGWLTKNQSLQKKLEKKNETDKDDTG